MSTPGNTINIKKNDPSMSALRLIHRSCVLVIEPDASVRRVLCDNIRAMGYDAAEAETIHEAEARMAQAGERIDALIMDWTQSNTNDIAWVKNRPQSLKGKPMPVILLIAPEQIQAAVDAGVIYYLTKPIAPNLLNTVVNAVLKEAQRQTNLSEAWQKQRDSFNLMDTSSFNVTTIAQAEDVACSLAGFFPNPQRVLIGIAELLINAIEHGNLGIGYEEKARLMREGTWEKEVAYRQALAENKGKTVQAVFQRSPKGCYISIKDQGQGFDWHNYLRLSLSRASEYHGRGIALANLVSFDKLAYNDKGNQVTAFVGVEPDLSW